MFSLLLLIANSRPVRFVPAQHSEAEVLKSGDI
jgi:hypothetical protein